eukprot:CAMPEP_0119007482 /NCGR_PEP_ID=MMETSP1176-20130426/3039_1 /TAXON_ID=265551 /ORGANISM="Synedropsis recta cf, Strain CCMP1620" /LENGTH=222 /DNA_ID=CAMNT_0006959645 /DNA_START=62 /DNA_END=730 /DNA_ORIENTATION=-
MMYRTTMILRALILLVLPLSVSSTALQVSGTPKCTGAFTLNTFSADCGNECSFGRQVDITGSISSSAGFSSSVHVKSTACLLSVICITLVETDGDICDSFEASDGQECPAAGAYDFSTDLRLPGDDGSDWFHGYWIDVHASFTDDNGDSTSCKVTVKAVQSSYQMAYMASFAGIALLTGLSALSFKRRRSALAGDEDEEDERNDPTSDFEMMKDPVNNGVTV